MPRKTHPKGKYNRKRQFSPKQCKKGSFRIKSVGKKGTKVVLCKKKGSKKQSVQSVLKPKKKRG